MQIVKDLNLNASSFDSKANGPLDEAKKAFKSIFNAKIDKNNYFYPDDNFQNDNKIEEKVINFSFSVRDYSSFETNNNWQDLLKEANIAEKDQDEDIEKAQRLITRVDQYLYGNSAIQSKTFRVKKNELFSAIKGLEKLNLSPDNHRESEKRSLHKTNSNPLEKNKEFDPIERRKVVLQFKDAKVTFSPEKMHKSKNELYQVQVSAPSSTNLANAKEDNSPSKIAGPTSSDMIKNDGVKSDSSSKDKNGDGHPSQSNDPSADSKKENFSKDQVLQLVKSKSELAASVLAEDENLKIEFKPLSENLKIANSEKVMKTNIESVSSVVETEEIAPDGIDKIMPSGNLKGLLSSQNGVLQVNEEALPSELANLSNISLAKNNVSILSTGDTKLESGAVLLENKELATVNDKSLQTIGGGKALQNSASASVLDRINQVAMIQKISNRIQLRQLKEFGIVNIQLDPPELGKLFLKLTVKGKEIKVSILTESSSAFEMLKNHKQLFMQSMKENGLDITEFEVNTRDNSSLGSFSQQNENDEQFKNENAAKLPVKVKEINYDNQPINLDTVNLSDGYHISYIA